MSLLQVLQDLITDALKSPWRPDQAATLANETGAETVTEAVARTQRGLEVSDVS